MNLGNSLLYFRKKSGLSQESVAEKLGVSRQTISKWEVNETLPDIRQSKMMAQLYNTTVDELIEFDSDIQEIQAAIARTSDRVTEKINWTNVWGKKYPILVQYQNKVNIPNFALKISGMLDELKQEYLFSEQDAMLILKDIMYHVWKKRKSQK